MTPLDVAREAWGADLPDWVEALAIECGKTSQNKVSKRLGRSAALVSTVLRRKYEGSYPAVEEMFRGVFQNLAVECPALGALPANECQEWRKKGREFVGTNALRSRMYRACLNCPRNGKEGGQS